MNDDLLKEATRALREDAADDGAAARFTRARVMASLHQGKVKRRTRLAFILPIAACLAAGTAWGAASGRLPAMVRAVAQLVGYGGAPVEPSQPKRLPPAVNQRPKPASASEAASPTPVPTEAEAPPVVEAPVARAQPSLPPPARPAESGAAAKAPPAASAAFQDSDGDLYRLAHEAHFSAHDYARALAGWNAYLQAAPGGRLATEARYNRAICLLRLGRDLEARQALEPFASGQMGYRQSEARELLEELSR